MKRPFQKVMFLTIEKMKRRAFHLRLLINRSKNKNVRRAAIKEYVSLIQRINLNN